MKKLLYITGILFMFIIAGCSGIAVQGTYHPDPTFQALDNYGTWINVPDLGLVWKPFDETNWQPYYDGHWIWTDSGWMWVGNEPYGWIVYHYGNWDYEEPYGWVWIPNYDWQPARVSWYYSNGYVGWAPLPPPGVRRRIVYNNVYVNRVWVVVPEKNFISRDVSHYKTRDASPDIERIRNNSGGRAPDVSNIERVTNSRIEPVNPVREQVNAGNRRLIRVRVPEQSRQNDMIRNNPPAVQPIPNPPAFRTPGTEPPKPPNPAPAVKKNIPAKPTPPVRTNRVEKGRNQNAIRNEGRKEPVGKKPGAIKKKENKSNNPRVDKKIKKDEKKAVTGKKKEPKKESNNKIIR